MYCQNCGNELEQDDVFCNVCGEQVLDDTSTYETNTYMKDATFVNIEQPVMQPQIVDTPPTNQPKQNKTPLIVAIICIAVVALVAIGAFIFVQVDKNNKMHAPIPVSFSFVIPNYDTTTGSGVPIQITGTDLDGNTVSQTTLIGQQDPEIELPRGTYDISVIGSPVSGEGGIYKNPDSIVQLDITEDNDVIVNGETVQEINDSSDTVFVPSITFEPIEPQDVTDAEIDSIKQWMQELGLSTAETDNYIGLINSSKQEAIQRIEAEKLEAWRSKMTGEYTGSGKGSPALTRISLSVDGDKLTITGALHTSASTGSYNSLGTGEWHFLLTPDTKYGWYADEWDFEETREEFINRALPNNFPGLTITVNNGYVVSIITGD